METQDEGKIKWCAKSELLPIELFYDFKINQLCSFYFMPWLIKNKLKLIKRCSRKIISNWRVNFFHNFFNPFSILFSFVLVCLERVYSYRFYQFFLINFFICTIKQTVTEKIKLLKYWNAAHNFVIWTLSNFTFFFIK